MDIVWAMDFYFNFSVKFIILDFVYTVDFDS